MTQLSFLDLIVLSIATWRLAYFATREKGPFAIARRLRDRFPLGGLSTCTYCASFWCAALWLILWFTPLVPIVYIFALSGAALMLGSYTGVNRN